MYLVIHLLKENSVHYLISDKCVFAERKIVLLDISWLSIIHLWKITIDSHSRTFYDYDGSRDLYLVVNSREKNKYFIYTKSKPYHFPWNVSLFLHTKRVCKSYEFSMI